MEFSTTAANVLFFGEDSGAFVALDARNGKQLWYFQTNQMWKASPMTYLANGKQYVAVARGIERDRIRPSVKGSLLHWRCCSAVAESHPCDFPVDRTEARRARGDLPRKFGSHLFPLPFGTRLANATRRSARWLERPARAGFCIRDSR